MRIIGRVQANTQMLDKIAALYDMSIQDVVEDIQTAVLEHIVLTEAEIPDELKGKLNVKFHYIPGRGYILNYGINSEPSTRLSRSEGNVFIPGPAEKGSQGGSGKVVKAGGIERPSVTGNYAKNKIITAATAATAAVSALIPKIVPKTWVKRAVAANVAIRTESSGGTPPLIIPPTTNGGK